MGTLLLPEPTSQPTGWLKDRRHVPTSLPSLLAALASTASPSCSSSRTSQSTSLRTLVPHPGNVHPYLYPKPHASSLGLWLLLRDFPGLPIELRPTLTCCPSCHSYQLAQRTFRTFDFYKKHQEAMTPAGLAFFQCRWDDSVTHTFHQLLGKGILEWWSTPRLQPHRQVTLSPPLSLYSSCRHAGTCV